MPEEQCPDDYFDPIMLYCFEDGGTDSGSAGNTGTFEGDAYAAGGGYILKGLFQDGSTDYLDLGDIPDMDGLTEFTIAAWIYRDGYNTHLTAVFSKDGAVEAFISSGNWGVSSGSL